MHFIEIFGNHLNVSEISPFKKQADVYEEKGSFFMLSALIAILETLTSLANTFKENHDGDNNGKEDVREKENIHVVLFEKVADLFVKYYWKYEADCQSGGKGLEKSFTPILLSHLRYSVSGVTLSNSKDLFHESLSSQRHNSQMRSVVLLFLLSKILLSLPPSSSSSLHPIPLREMFPDVLHLCLSFLSSPHFSSLSLPFSLSFEVLGIGREGVGERERVRGVREMCLSVVYHIVFREKAIEKLPEVSELPIRKRERMRVEEFGWFCIFFDIFLIWNSFLFSLRR